MKKSAVRPRFPRVDAVSLAGTLRELEPAGRTFTPRLASSCYFCRRRISGIGRSLTPGLHVCASTECQAVRSGQVTKHFATPYGRALSRTVLAVICRLPERNGRIFVEHYPIRQWAGQLAAAFEDLVAWQVAWDEWDHHRHPDQYERGGVSILPPRFLEDVVTLRANVEPCKVDPTQGLPEDIREELHRVRVGGADALAAPF